GPAGGSSLRSDDNVSPLPARNSRHRRLCIRNVAPALVHLPCAQFFCRGPVVVQYRPGRVRIRPSFRETYERRLFGYRRCDAARVPRPLVAIEQKAGARRRAELDMTAKGAFNRARPDQRQTVNDVVGCQPLSTAKRARPPAQTIPYPFPVPALGPAAAQCERRSPETPSAPESF